jgi:hypothetical protein
MKKIVKIFLVICIILLAIDGAVVSKILSDVSYREKIQGEHTYRLYFPLPHLRARVPDEMASDECGFPGVGQGEHNVLKDYWNSIANDGCDATNAFYPGIVGSLLLWILIILKLTRIVSKKKNE